jgi:hypothetical protein
MVISYDDNCYYKINPYDLQSMEYTSQEYLNNFEAIYMARDELKIYTANNMWDIYYNIVIKYKASLMEKEVEEIAMGLQQL